MAPSKKRYIDFISRQFNEFSLALAHALDPSGLGHAATLTRRPEGPPGLETPTGTLRGCSNPAGLWCSALTR